MSKKKRSREELTLPGLTFVAADNWMNELGAEAFCAWLKLHTWVDRTDKDRKFDLIPMPLEGLSEKLKVSNSTFMRWVKKLWEFGFIELVEYAASKRSSQKPKNIVVYKYPNNDEANKVLPIKKLRDWKKDYKSVAKEFGQKGFQVKQEKKAVVHEEEQQEDISMPTPSKNERVDPSKNERVTPPNLKGNNISNNSINSSNTSNNNSNKDLSIILEELKNLDIPEMLISFLADKTMDRLIYHFEKYHDIFKPIEDLYKKYGTDFSWRGFGEVIQRCLKPDSYKYSFSAYTETSLTNDIIKRSAPKPNHPKQQDKSANEKQTELENKYPKLAGKQQKQPVRQEMLPDWHTDPENQEQPRKLSPLEQAQTRLGMFGWKRVPEHERALLAEHGIFEHQEQEQHQEIEVNF